MSGLVLAAPLAAALAGATLVGGASTSSHHLHSTNTRCVSLLCTTTGTGGGDLRFRSSSVTDSRAKPSAVVAGLVLAAPLAAAALASAIIGGGMPAAQAHQPKSALVRVLYTTIRTGSTDPKIPEAAGD